MACAPSHRKNQSSPDYEDDFGALPLGRVPIFVRLLPRGAWGRDPSGFLEHDPSYQCGEVNTFKAGSVVNFL